MKIILIKHLKLSFLNFCSTIFQCITGKITLKYTWIKISSQLNFVGKRQIDGVDWKIYSKHYSEELKMIEKTNITRITKNSIFLDKNKIIYRDKNYLRLHPNHELLYETVLNLSPKSVLEVGCGGGDHLANLNQLNPKLELYGADVSPEQLNLLNFRHPDNNFQLSITDITSTECSLPKVDLIYTQAVLMHITEKQNRFFTSMDNLLHSSAKHIVLMENWTQHNFFETAKKIISISSDWKIFYSSSTLANDIRIMVISKSTNAHLNPLNNYDELLLGKSIKIH